MRKAVLDEINVMKFIETGKLTPEENLSFDEDLLKKAEEGTSGEVLRIWESDKYFVVIGRSEKQEEECFLETCQKDNIPVLKRISGGGTVLQGPGCLNYSLIIRYDRNKEFNKINASYKILLEELSKGFNKEGVNSKFFPICDLAIDNKKFSGNAQARKRNHFLMHGTILYDFDLEKVGKYIKHPYKEPEYREKRPHSSFITNIGLSKEDVIRVIKNTFLFL